MGIVERFKRGEVSIVDLVHHISSNTDPKLFRGMRKQEPQLEDEKPRRRVSDHTSEDHRAGRCYWGRVGECDAIELDLSGVSAQSLKSAFRRGDYGIVLVDGRGETVPVVQAMWTENGELQVPRDVSGVIIGPDGDTLRFADVVTIRCYREMPQVG